MTQRDVEGFAALLKAHGYGDAMNLIMQELIPLAREEKISLYQATKNYAESPENGESLSQELKQALAAITQEDLDLINVQRPFYTIDTTPKD